MSVSTSGSGSTSIFTFDSQTRVINWLTNSNSDAGTYSITVTGTITALSIFTKTTSFNLLVFNC
jgi:hypothetical protein